MGVRRITVMAAVALLAAPALASAGWTPRLTASDVRLGDHPAFVRVVVDFAGAPLNNGQVEARRFDRTATSVLITAPNVSSHVMAHTAFGVRARVIDSPGHLVIRMDYSGGFKYLSYTILTGNRLVMDLWKARPPIPAAEIRTAPNGCLSLRSWHVERGHITVTGRERNLFEHSLVVFVRGRTGGIRGMTPHGVQAAAGKWHTHVAYTAKYRQAGTLEAVDFSAKDGALDCIAQVRVTLPATG